MNKKQLIIVGFIITGLVGSSLAFGQTNVQRAAEECARRKKLEGRHIICYLSPGLGERLVRKIFPVKPQKERGVKKEENVKCNPFCKDCPQEKTEKSKNKNGLDIGGAMCAEPQGCGNVVCAYYGPSVLVACKEISANEACPEVEGATDVSKSQPKSC